MSAAVPGWLRPVGARIRLGLRILHACLRHLADEDAWERHQASQLRGRVPAATCGADAGPCSRHELPSAGHDEQGNGPASVSLDRGRFWQEESERRWNGVRRCC